MDPRDPSFSEKRMKGVAHYTPGEIDSESTPEEALAHYGVKGMKWGVINEDGPTGDTSSGSDGKISSVSGGESAPEPRFDFSAPKKSKSEAMAENEAKFAAKFDPSTSGLKQPSKVRQAGEFVKDHKVAVAVGVLGAAYIGSTLYTNSKISPPKPGETKEVSGSLFNTSVSKAKWKSWTGNGYIQDSSYHHDGYEFPAGHTFHRLSTNIEDSFGSKTYATAHIDDFNRYASAFTQEIGTKGLQHITFQTTGTFRVPSLETTLSSLQEVLSAHPTYGPSFGDRSAAISMYNHMSGGQWNDSVARDLFSNLKAKGFSGIVDEMDAGVIGEAPMVLFNHDILTQKTSVPMTAADLAAATTNLPLIPKPPSKA